MAMLDTDLGQRLWFVSSAFKAWCDDVASFAPPMIKSFFEDPEPQWIIELGSEHLSVLENHDGQLENGAELHDWRDQDEALSSFLKITGILAPKKAAGGIIALQKEMLMKRTFSLPLQAEINLSRLLAAQLDTLTPFGPEEALVGWVVTERHLSERRLQVDLFVAPKAKLEGLTEIFLQATGKAPIFRCPHEGAEGYSVTLKTLNDSGASRRRLGGLLAAITLGLLILAQAVPISLLERQVSSLETQIEINQVNVEDSLNVRRRLDELSSSLALLSERDTNSQSSLSLMLALTQVVPDGASFDRLLQTESQIEINGTATDAYALLGLMQGLDGISGARFLAPVVADQKLGKHRFRLVLTLGEG